MKITQKIKAALPLAVLGGVLFSGFYFLAPADYCSVGTVVLTPKAENGEGLERALRLNQELLKRASLFSGSSFLANKIQEKREVFLVKPYSVQGGDRVSIETDKENLAIQILAVHPSQKGAIETRDLFVKAFGDHFLNFFNFASVSELKVLMAEETAYPCRQRIWYYPLLGTMIGFLTALLAFSFPKSHSLGGKKNKKMTSLPMEEHNVFKKEPDSFLAKKESTKSSAKDFSIEPPKKQKKIKSPESDLSEEGFEEDETKIKERLNRLINGEF